MLCNNNSPDNNNKAEVSASRRSQLTAEATAEAGNNTEKLVLMRRSNVSEAYTHHSSL